MVSSEKLQKQHCCHKLEVQQLPIELTAGITCFIMLKLKYQ